MTCRWGLHVSDPAGGPVRLSGNGFAESAVDVAPVARAAEPLGRPSGALPLNLARCAQLPPRSGPFR